MDIVIVAQYLRNIEDFECNNSRFVYLAKMLAKTTKNNIEIITSNFNHAKKEKFNKIGNLEGIKITTCQEPGYPKNVCLRRFSSHKKLAQNIKEYLEKRKKPDIIYTAVPSLAVAEVCANYCKDNNVKFIVDVQDLWPEAFKIVFNIPIISDIVFYPMKRQANYIYKAANNIVAVSQTYLDRALKVNNKSTKNEVVFLGTEMEIFDKYNINKGVQKNNNIIKIVYIGTLGHSYDIKIIIDAIKILNEKEIKNIEFLIMGDGPLRENFEEYAKQKNVNCVFTGILQYNEMIPKLCNCDIAVNPIKKGSAGSIINKVGDYAMAGLPVINTQENEEYRNLVEKYKIGYNCQNGDAYDIAEKIKKLCNNKKLRDEYGTNNRKLAEEKIDRNKTYEKIYELVVVNDRKN